MQEDGDCFSDATSGGQLNNRSTNGTCLLDHRIFTLIELLISISIICILLAILLPALHHAREKAHEIACAGNLKQLGIATYSYTLDFNSYVLPAVLDNDGDNVSFLTYFYNNDIKDPRLFTCPSFSKERDFFDPYDFDSGDFRPLSKASYIMNSLNEWTGSPPLGHLPKSECRGWMGAQASQPLRVSSICSSPSETIFVTDCLKRPDEYESTTGWNTDMSKMRSWKETDHGDLPANSGADRRDMGNHHTEGFNALMGDGRVIKQRQSQSENWVIWHTE